MQQALKCVHIFLYIMHKMIICSDKEIELSAVSQICRNIEKHIFYIMRYDTQRYKFSGKKAYIIAG